MITLTFDTEGAGHGLYTEAIDLTRLGVLRIQRATSIEFDHERQSWCVRDTRGRPLFTAPVRQRCLDWEQQHFNQ